MALDSYEYGDPMEVAIRNENLQTCVACAKHVKTVDRTGFRCAFDIDGYPDKTRKTCRYWAKKRREPGCRY